MIANKQLCGNIYDTIGSKEFPTRQVIQVIRRSKDFHLFHETWTRFALDLGISQEIIKSLKQDLLLNKKQLYEVMHELVEIWVGMEGKQATFWRLLSALDTNGLSSIAELFRTDSHQIETFCSSLNFYIRRTLASRNLLNKNLFIQEVASSSDIFVFSGVEWHQLCNFIPNQSFDRSTNQIHEPELTQRLITLDHPNHFREICDKTTHPVHLIQVDITKGEWLHLKSSKNLQCMHNLKDKRQLSLKEDFFIKTRSVINNYPIIFSDSPGMGKSTLLQHIKVNLEKYSKRLVLFAGMNHLVSLIATNHLNHDSSTVLEFVSKISCKNGIERSSFQSKLQSNHVEIELLLDGLDEVDPISSELAFNILKTLSAYHSIRLWITTRPHLLAQLETTLNVFGYNILPFTEEDQVGFLTTFWTSKATDLNISYLEHFAKTCLNELKSRMNTKDEDIAGIPLQCHLIGEVYEKQALELASNSSSNKSGVIIITTLIELYQLLISNRMEKYYNFYGQNAKLQNDQIFSQHTRLAIQIIFPELVDSLPSSYPKDINLNELLNIGLLERSSTASDPKFIHRTVGEYFVAKFLAEMITSGKNELVNCLNEFITKVIMPCWENELELNSYQAKKSLNSFSFVNSEVCYFLNILIGSNHNCKTSGLLESIKKVVHACAFGQLFNLFQIFYEFCNENNILNEVFDRDFLFLTIRYSNLQFVETVFKHFDKIDEDTKTLALCLAVQNGNSSILQYLVNVKNLKVYIKNPVPYTKLLLHECVRDTLFDSDVKVKRKREIISFLTEINSKLLEEKDADSKTPILCEAVHANLISELFSHNANILERDAFKNTIFHVHVDHHKLLMCNIDTKILKKLIKLRNLEGDTPLLTLVKSKDPEPEVIEKFKENKANFNSKNLDGHSVIVVGIMKGRMPLTISKLIECGADLNWRKGWRRKSVLHYAAQYGNIEAMRCLVNNFTMDVMELDWSLKSSLDYLIKYFKNKQCVYIDLARAEFKKLIDLVAESEMKFDFKTREFLLKKSIEYMLDSGVKYLLDQGLNTSEKNEIYESNSDENIFQIFAQNFTPDSGLNIFEMLLTRTIICREERFLNKFIKEILRNENLKPSDFHEIVEILCKNNQAFVFNSLGDETEQSFLNYCANRIEMEERTIKLLNDSGVNFKFVDKNKENLLFSLIRETPNINTLQFSLFIKYTEGMNQLNTRLESLLHLAAQVGSMDMMKYLINEGLDINGLNFVGQTPLFYTLFEKDKSNGLEKAKLLLNHGADVNKLTFKKRNLAHYTAYFCLPEFLQYFVDNGLNVNVKDNDGKSALCHLYKNNGDIIPDKNYDKVLVILNKYAATS